MINEDKKSNNKKTCHSEFISESQKHEMLKQVQHDMRNRHCERSAAIQKEIAPTSILPHKGGNITPSLMREGWDGCQSKKIAFTLAEVLITLGIIGIVAAMTLPSIINNIRHKELETAFKKAYSSISQAIKLYEAENGTPLQPSDIQVRQLKAMIMPYFKIVRDCGMGMAGSSSIESACVPNPGFWDDKDKDENYKATYKNYNGTSEINLYAFDDGQFVINDGMLILIENSGGANNGRDFQKWISVDVNGYNKRPNRLGQDLFMFRLGESGNLIPGGANDTADAYCSKTSTDINNGRGCTVKALSDPDFFKNLP